LPEPRHTEASNVAPMLACARTFALDGVLTRPVSVEVDVRPGLPSFTIVGLGDAAVRESRERVRGAIQNSGFDFPQRRITANLAPAHLPKIGPGFDLPLACAVLVASGQVPADRLPRLALFGELSLTGSVRPAQGTLAVAQAARGAGLEGLVVATPAAREAALVRELAVACVSDLRGAAEALRGRPTAPAPASGPEPRSAADGRAGDLADVCGQDAAVRAAVVAAAGGHNLLLSGPPGVGKTMLAWRLPGLLPPLDEGEAIEVTRLHSIVAEGPARGLIRERPFRAPHHSITAAGLVGGAHPRRPGEAILAHHGVLFLDELSEFSRAALEALRQPLEDGRVAIVRAAHTTVHPTRFMLVAATNPCPCGFGGMPDRCICTEADVARHRRRLSGPLLDRVDVLVHLQLPTIASLRAAPAVNSRQARAAVLEARARQAARGAGFSALNARLDRARLARFGSLDARGDEVMARAFESGMLSARGHDRILRVARTIADLAGSDRVRAEHVMHALSLRQEAVAGERRVA
jgi:magnesium chelatase family protein